MSIYNGIKEEMIEMIERWDFDTLSVEELKFEKKKMMKYIEIAIYTKKRMASLVVTKEESNNNKIEATKEKTESIEEGDAKTVSPLKRLLSGGTLNQNEIYVPEKIIRSLNLNHGDILNAECYKELDDGRKLYNYQLVESKNQPDADGRNQVSYAVVQYDEKIQSFYIEEDVYHQSIYIDDSPIRMVVSQRDSESFELKIGDIVDIAWYNHKFNEAKVIWKYAIEELSILKHKQKKKSKEQKEKTGSNLEDVEQNLLGKTISLIGCEPYHAELRKVVEERGGEVTCLSGEEPRRTLESSIRKSDTCIVAIQHVSHNASKYANATAKEYNIPFESFNGYGKWQFLSAVYKSLNLFDSLIGS